MHQSIATIQSPEFINLQPLDINPLMSSCEIKVLYVGENRNRSFITKEVATEMAKTLRGAPIVGYYKEQKEDYADHGNVVTIDDEGFHFECMTKPYGFVSPDAKVWFQTFEDTDDFGNVETREYLMTTGYLWTGQFEECNLAIKEGRPQSMELDETSLEGRWETNKKNGMDFFIINDATFSKLCILGDDVEPCFEGASVTAPKVSSSFTLDDEFKKTLFTMMQELQFALQGGQQMENEVVVSEVETNFEEKVVEEPVSENPVSEEFVQTEEIVENFAASEEEKKEKESEENSETKKEEEEKEDEYSKKEEKDKEETEKSDSQDETKSSDEKEEEKEKEDKYALLEESYKALETKYSELEIAYNALVEFKNQIEDAKKEEMIKKFYFLSDEDKKDVIENKANYTVEEIESKLSVICVRNKVNFDLEDSNKNDINTEEPIKTYSMNMQSGSEVPAWISAVKNIQNKK